jgi:hypothetical protein
VELRCESVAGRGASTPWPACGPAPQLGRWCQFQTVFRKIQVFCVPISMGSPPLGARLDLRHELLNSTPLGWACRWGRKELAELLIARGAPNGKSGRKDLIQPL